MVSRGGDGGIPSQTIGHKLAVLLGLRPAEAGHRPSVVLRILAWFVLLQIVFAMAVLPILALGGWWSQASAQLGWLRGLLSTLLFVGFGVWLVAYAPPFRYGPEASFKMSEDAASGDTVFQVTPARASRIYFLFFAFLILVIIALPWYLTLLFGPIVAFGIFANRAAFRSILKARHPAEIRVSDSALMTAGRTWPLADIASLEIGADIGQIATTTTNLRTGATSTGETAGDRLWNRQSERSRFLVLRLRGTSEREILCGGLTGPCAGALLDDLAAAIGKRGVELE